MSKELTEKFRNGTLEQKYYYVKYFGNGQKPFVEIELKNFLLDLVKVKDSDKIEVLAAVPTYDEFIQQRDFVKDHLKVLIENMNLKRKLEIATKALKEQLKEANDLLKGLYDDSPCQFDHLGYCQEHGSTDGNYICVQCELKEYLERYGVE